jgi:Rrf2 family nitric oxide-sensitive transcriptional repressor
MYLAVQGERLATIREIAESYDISRNHLMKVVHQLNRKGYLKTVRGKKGGLRLHLKPEDINLGILVRETEPDFELVECFSSDNLCNITPVCGLKHVMAEALQSFLNTLDQYTLEDLLPDRHKPQLMRILQIA